MALPLKLTTVCNNAARALLRIEKCVSGNSSFDNLFHYNVLPNVLQPFELTRKLSLSVSAQSGGLIHTDSKVGHLHPALIKDAAHIGW